MYSIIVNGREVGIVESPVYILLQSNGYFGLADEQTAQGINYNGKHYQLADREDMGRGFDTAMLIEVDAGERIKTQNQVASIAFVKMAEEGTIDDVTAGEHADLFPEWNENGVSYTANQIVRHEGKLYKCIMQHNSQSDWAPGAAGTDALWKQIADPGEEWPEWSQPIGAHDCYNTGDKVTYNGEHYTSLIDGNVWKPDEYPAGWKKEE